jgi:predicted dehydrogenase
MIATRFVIEKSLAAIQNGTKPPASAEDGRDVLEVIAACYHSAATGRRVSMADAESLGLAGMRMGSVPAT